MIPSNFAYHAPDTLETALQLLDQHADDVKILSGGHSLLPVLKLRLAAPAVLVDIGRIAALRAIKIENGVIRLGANATHAAIAASAEIKQHCPLLAETAAQIGDPQVRNRGTIGGSLTHADPAADWPAAMLALNAEIVVRSSSGERAIQAADFFVDMLTSAVEPNEIVTEIRVPVPAQPKAAAYLKVAQSASGFALVGVAVQLKLNNGQCEEISIGVTGLAPKAYRAKAVEDALRGKTLDAAAIRAASGQADADASDALGDIHASADYRRHLSRVYAQRAINAARSRA
ncbi:MAG: xanthine dehydrogenase family protein subunit M [Acidobacteria bacterium]|nr:xanthine dehydrogenase family protein subunit M [Acidobacteriota bacterium]MBI3428257.1 xanthine dehydrogenase family protein subunit M [Acidobacteriota bacterium]